MKTAKLTFFFTVAMTSLSFADPIPVGPYNFGGGLDLVSIETEMRDQDTPDSANCINDRLGGAFKRNGSKRFVSQAISTHPFTSLYKAYASSGTARRSVLLGTVGDRIVSSTGGVNPFWTIIATFLAPNQHWSFATINNRVVMDGDGLYNDPLQYDVVSSSLSRLTAVAASTGDVIVRSKYNLNSKNYLLKANVLVAPRHDALLRDCTYYPSRLYHSLLLQISSMTGSRFIEYRTEDGEEITGIGEMNDAVHIFKPSSIGELTFTILGLPSEAGDKELVQRVKGFGLEAPRTLANTGQFYVLGSKDGIRLWDGGNRSRLTVSEESRIISGKIKPLIDKLIKAGTYRNAVGVYYPKQEWYVLSYEDPDKFPRGKNNSIIVYDFLTGEWFPFTGWLADSFAVADGFGDNGDLYYGDSNDGYVHIADLEGFDDSRKEIPLDSMDSTTTWKNSDSDFFRFQEGTGSAKIYVNSGVTESSMTKLFVMNLGEWPDKRMTSRSDKLAFKVFVTSLPAITSFRLDLEVEDVSEAFNQFFTSVSFTSAAFTGGDNNWTQFEIPLSSFPLASSWTDLGIEDAPFANGFSFYGARFVLAGNGIGVSSAVVDDFRYVQRHDSPVRMHRFTKLYDMGTLSFKTQGQVFLTREKSPDANFFVDIYNDFGQKVRTEEFEAEVPKELLNFRYQASTGISILSSVDLSLIRSTYTPREFSNYLNGTWDKDYIYTYDRQNDKLTKIDRGSLTVVVSTYGQLGSGTTNFDLVHAMQGNRDKSILGMTDLNNHRVKQHRKDDLSFIRMAGSLGNKTSSYHQPTGITTDGDNWFVADEGNFRWLKLNSTFGYVLAQRIDNNTVADTSLRADERHVFGAYNKISEESVNNLEVILEKREKGGLNLVQRVSIKPLNFLGQSTFTLLGDIGLMGRHYFISFTDNNQRYYLQKRLKSDSTIVKEMVSTLISDGFEGDPYPYIPMLKTEAKELEVEGRYIQLNYRDPEDTPDNHWRLYRQTFLVNKEQDKFQELGR